VSGLFAQEASWPIRKDGLSAEMWPDYMRVLWALGFGLWALGFGYQLPTAS